MLVGCLMRATLLDIERCLVERLTAIRCIAAIKNSVLPNLGLVVMKRLC